MVRARTRRALTHLKRCFRKIPTYGGGARAHTAPVKVLLVEDSPMLRQRVEAILASIPGATSAGHAAGAAEAIAAIERERPDTVVLDIHLENGNGFDVLRALPPGTRAYVLTNFANEAYRRKAMSLGAAGFFDKTTEFDRLRDALVGIVRP
jgi:two-component system, NarL family, response regulator DevR